MSRRFVNLLAGLMWSAALAGVSHADQAIGVAVDLTGPDRYQGDQVLRGAELAVDLINESGGLLGKRISIVPIDDGCVADQAEAAARVLVERHVAMVVGHLCSAASLAGAPIYEAAGTIMISPSSTNPKVTDEGRRNIFRVIGRDDLQGAVAAKRLLDEFSDRNIAVVHDDTPYGYGLADQTRKELHRLGLNEVLFTSIDPDALEHAAFIEELQKHEVDVLYYGGDAPEAALLLRQARQAGLALQLVSGDALAAEEFTLVVGDQGDGTLFTFPPDPRSRPEAADIVARFQSEGTDPIGYTMHGLAAVQAWSQAVTAAGTFESEQVIRTLKTSQFDTVLGPIGFDDKGDVEGAESFVWYKWRNGEYEQQDPD